MVRVEMLTGRTKDREAGTCRALTAETARIAKCADDQVHVITTEISPANRGLGDLGDIRCPLGLCADAMR
jgi:hypothetical protein